MEPFIKKYSPLKSSEIVGQDAALTQLKDFIVNFKKAKKKAKKSEKKSKSHKKSKSKDHKKDKQR